jgi:TPR repeat protein
MSPPLLLLHRYLLAGLFLYVVVPASSARAAPPCRSTADCEKRCQQGSLPAAAESCWELGRLHQQGQGGAARDPARARRAWNLACDGGHGPACAALGVAFDRGDGVPKDLYAALQYHHKGCALEVGTSCEVMATSFEKGWRSKPNPFLERRYLIRACQLGVADACGFRVGNNTINLANPNDTPASLPRAVVHFAEECQLGHSDEACSTISILLLEGRGIPRDPARLRTILEAGCLAGSTRACLNLGASHLGGDLMAAYNARAVLSSRKRCHEGRRDSCHDLAWSYLTGRDGVDKDPHQASELLKRACGLGLEQSCATLQRLRPRR